MCKPINPKFFAIERDIKLPLSCEPFTTYSAATVMRFFVSIVASNFPENSTGFILSFAKAVVCVLCSFTFIIWEKVF